MAKFKRVEPFDSGQDVAFGVFEVLRKIDFRPGQVVNLLKANLVLGQKHREGFFMLNRVSALSHTVIKDRAQQRHRVSRHFEKPDRLANQVVIARAAPDDRQHPPGAGEQHLFFAAIFGTRIE